MNENADLTLFEHPEHIFPTLTAAHIARFAARGKPRKVGAGQILVEQGDPDVPFFVVVSGVMEAVRPTVEGENEVAVFRAGQFSGDIGMLSGRRSLLRTRMREAGEFIELDRSNLQDVIQNDGELSEILMRAFILRRLELIGHGWGDVVLLGSNNSSGTLRIKEFLTRNAYPYSYVRKRSIIFTLLPVKCRF
jgi:thioredoxin reductase (NADPH)